MLGTRLPQILDSISYGSGINPNGRGNADVVRPWCNGMDLARRPSNTWIIDFGELPLVAAQLYEAPFAHVEANILPHRAKNNDKHRKTFWWQHGRPASRAKAAIGNADWMIATPLTSKHRWFVRVPSKYFPDNSVVVIMRDNYTIFGILSSAYHVAWAVKRVVTSWELAMIHVTLQARRLTPFHSPKG
jgi:hypothetical protein